MDTTMTEDQVKALTQAALAQLAYECLVPDSHGRYMGQVLAELYGHKLLDMPNDALAILKSGPDHSEYDEVCSELSDYCRILDHRQAPHCIEYMDGGIFAVDYDLIHEWEELTDQDFFRNDY